MFIACTRIFCSIIIIVLGLLFLLLPAYHHHHASVGFFGGYPADDHRYTSAMVGDHILRRRKMIATSPHASPSSPRNLRKLLRTSPEHEDRSTATTFSGDKERTEAWTSDDVTKKKQGIWCGGGRKA